MGKALEMLNEAEALGLRTKDIADITGITPDKVSKVRAGKRRLTAGEMERLREFLVRRSVARATGGGDNPSEGAETKGLIVSVLSEDKWTLLPLYDLAAFDRREASGQIVFPPALEMVPVRRTDLARLHITRSEVWLIEMPTNILPSVARQGELLVCQDGGIGFHDRSVIVLAFGGDPSIIRRVVRASDGTLTLQADDPSVPPITIAQLAGGFARFGEVLGAIRTLPAA